MLLKLQKILYPKRLICSETELYFRIDEGGKLNAKEHNVFIPNNKFLRFNTYFNSFSLDKWLLYTSVSNLHLHLECKGKFIIYFTTSFVKKGNVVSYKQEYLDYFEDNYDKQINVEKGRTIHFGIQALEEDGYFYDGYYYTDIEEELLNPINVCMDICTFKREQYIIQNLRNISKEIINNKDSLLYQKLDINVSDNAHTLPEKLNSKHIRIYENPNTGGAGGFGRGMIEFLKLQPEKHYTHILLTDDDITLDPQVIEKTAAVLMTVKGKYKESFIGGSMFRLDQRNIQSEMANRWQGGKVIPLNYKRDMANFDNVVKNEVYQKINYLSWWYCCMPASVIREDNLPLPIFIKRDDIEYGLRNGSSFITLNGINVWHEPFEQKRPAYLEYYYIRNQLIMECTINSTPSLKRLKKSVFKKFKDEFTKFHYLEFEFYCKGLQDFCRGIDWLKSIDAVKLNLDLLANDRKFVPLEELDIPFDEVKYKQSFVYNETKRHWYLRALTLNGWLLPSKKEPIIVQSAFPIKFPYIRAKKALNVENITKRGYISEKSWKELFRLRKLKNETIKMLNKYYDIAVYQYKNRYKELMKINFWNDYLFNPEFGSSPNNDKPTYDKNYLPFDLKLKREKVYVYYREHRKVNDKLIYIESRKGSDFASNIFAVAKELNKKEYKGYKVYIGIEKDYVSTFLMKKKKNDLNSIKYVIKDGYKFQKIMATAKYFFTDFHLFPHFAKRPEQVIVSLWHGTPLKTLGKDCKAETQISVQRIFNIADYQVYPGKFMEDKMLDIYWQQNLYKGNVLCSGYPRNALFFDEERRKEIRNELGLNDKLAIMYMPTFRGSAGDNKNKEQNEMLISYFRSIDSLLNDNQIFYLKLHNYNAESIDVNEFKHIQMAPKEYDNYELQNACDIMVTDYSSVFFDFAVSRRKIILFQYDQEDYLTNRGVCLPLDELPFPIVKTPEELVEQINKPIEYDDRAFMKKYCTYDNKDASKILCSHVILGEKLPDGIKEYKLKRNRKKNIYIHTGHLRTPFSSYEFWKIMDKIDYDKANFYLMYHDPVMWKNAYRLLPMNDKCNQVGMWSYYSFTPNEYKINKKQLSLEPLSNKEKEVLRKMYDRELKKHFAYMDEPDLIILWDNVDVNMWQQFAHYGKKRIVVTNSTIGNPLLLEEQENYKLLSIEQFDQFIEKKYS